MSETTEVPDASSPEATRNSSGCGPTGCLCGGKGPAVSEMLRLMLPSDAAGEHFRNGTVEILKGIRELLDQRIRTMSASPAKGTKLNVE